MCHCLACQRRTGSVFGVQARFPRAQISVEGASSVYARKADSGNGISFHFCPGCGSTVYWEFAAMPDLVAVAVGAFADPCFPAPRHSVFEARSHGWSLTPSSLVMEHLD